VTSGPLLFFQAEGHPPGAEIKMGAGGGTVEVQAGAKSFVPFHHLEVILNGRVVASREEREGVREMTLKKNVPVPGAGWLAACCSSRHGPTTEWGFSISAHSSPVYVVVPWEELFSALAIAYLLTLVEGAETWVDNLATRPDPEQFQRVRNVFQDARANLHRRLHEHGIRHWVSIRLRIRFSHYQ